MPVFILKKISKGSRALEKSKLLHCFYSGLLFWNIKKARSF
jgi:hypothetical protein